MHDAADAVPRELLWSAVARWETQVRMRREQFERLRGAVRPPDDDSYWRRRVAGYYASVRARDDDGQLVRAALLELEAAGGTGEATLLDVGAGFGAAAVPIARAGFRVTVVEPSEAMLEYLERWATEERVRDRIDVVPRRWLEADVERHDVVLCAHVLYPIAEVAPFVTRLVDAARSACLIAMRAAANESVPASLFLELHGEERVPQPTLADLCGVLGELAVPYEARTWTSPSTWTYDSIDEAEEAISETLLVGDDVERRRRVRAWAEASLVAGERGCALPGGMVREGLAIVRPGR